MKSLLLVLALLATSSFARAVTITPVQPSPDEPDLAEVLDVYYGPGGVLRVSDDLDQYWSGTLIGATALSVNAAATQRLGVCTICDGSDDTFFDQSLTEQSSFPLTLTIAGEEFLSYFGSSFSWFDSASQHYAVGRVSSLPGLNPGGTDQMVTYTVAGKANTYVLAFEDWFSTVPTSDRDFNDLVVEVRFGGAPNTEVPEPGTVLLLGAGLIALGWMGRNRRRG